MASSAASIPVVGWGIAAAILAAIGIGLAIAAKKTKKANDNNESIKKTEDALNKLQAKIYNTNQAISTVSKLGDEFDTLSSKIIKTTDDLERMNEIAKEVNDTLGYTAVDTNADVETQRLQIRGAQATLKSEKKKTVSESASTLVSGFSDKAGEYAAAKG